MRSRATRIQPHILVNKYVDGVPYANTVVDLSESGIALRKGVEPDHRKDAQILIELVLNSAKAPLWLECESARSSGPHFEAFAFADMSVPNQRIVRRFVEHRSLDV
jgi:hypothetical protein